jgi:endoglucanase
VRLTYSIDHALNQSVLVSDSFTAGAVASGNSVETFAGIYNDAVKQNPFLANATTSDVFGAVVDALWARGVMTILDNHVSKASWVCLTSPVSNLTLSEHYTVTGN